MGFKVEPTLYRLKFEDRRLHGLEVTARSVSIGEFMRLTGMTASQVTSGVDLTDGAVPRDELLAAVADAVEGWNLEDDQGPVKPCYDALASLEPYVVKAVVGAWLRAVSDVDPNYSAGSSAPGSSLESSLPMDTL